MKKLTSILLISLLVLSTAPSNLLAQERDPNPENGQTIDPSSLGNTLENPPEGTGDILQNAETEPTVDTPDGLEAEIDEGVDPPGEDDQVDDLSPAEEEDEEVDDLVQPEEEEAVVNFVDPPEDAPSFDAGPAVDPKQFLKAFQGQANVSPFTGSAGFTYPLWLPKGRSGIEPNVYLTYNPHDKRFESMSGYGWHTVVGGRIERVRQRGIDDLYTGENEVFAAHLFGGVEELVLIDAVEHIYAPLYEGSFIEYQRHHPNGVGGEEFWTARDRQGHTYTFGQATSARQDNPNDSTQVYQWWLERVEDLNRNHMTLSFFKDQGAIYPDRIRYTGNDDMGPGLFEIRFNLEEHAPYTSYKTGFGVTYEYNINRIELMSWQTGAPQTVMTYHFSYTNKNSAMHQLDSIHVEAANGQTLPATDFFYYDGSDSDGQAPAEDRLFKEMYSLREIRYPGGGSTHFTYQPASAWRGGGGNATNLIPFTTNVVRSRTEVAGPGEPGHATFYDYYRGHYYFDPANPFQREYAGFGNVVVTDPLGNQQHLYFHQSEFDPNNSEDALLGEQNDHLAKKGRMYRQELLNSSGTLLHKQITHWNSQLLTDEDPDEERRLVTPLKTVEVDYSHDGIQSRAKASDFNYNDQGNLIEQIDHGEVTLLDESGETGDAVFGDQITTTTDYADNVTNHVIGLPYLSERLDESGTLLSRERRYYDNEPLGTVGNGLLTQLETFWGNGANEHVIWQYEYNVLGLLSRSTNPRNHSTTVVYDAQLLYPHLITNPLGHTMTYTYDLFFGQPIALEDANNHVTHQYLDEFGRLISKEVEDPGGGLQEVESHEYDLTSYPNSVTKTTQPHTTDIHGEAIHLTERTYFDGLGRPIQSKTEVEHAPDGSNRYVVISSTYDERGQLFESYLPQFTAVLDYEGINPSDFKVTHTYDALSRKTEEMTPVGNSSISHGAWNQTVTDANGHPKAFAFDAYGRLSEVTEYNNGASYLTEYDYNGNGQLITMTDSEGNLRTMEYDLLGRRTQQTLLHDPLDGAPAAYHYTYDDNGNLLTRTDAKGQVLTYAYDDLDRLIEESDGISSIDFEYDQGAHGLGRLSSVGGNHFSKSFDYDALGRVMNEEKTIDGQVFNTDFDYVGLGAHVGTITYPDGTEVSYDYNNAGGIERVSALGTEFVEQIDYAPTGGLSYLRFGNGVETTHTFDPALMYRLTNTETLAADGLALQRIDYIFDPVGNITELIDSSDTATAREALYSYDDLDRLVSAEVGNVSDGSDYLYEYQYSPTGNMTAKDPIGLLTYEDKHPQAVTGADGNTYAYDLNGSLISTSGPGVDMVHEYNLRGQLFRSMTGGDAAFYEYEYDETGERTRKLDGAGTYETIYVSSAYETEDDGVAATSKRHLFAGNLKVVTLDENDRPHYAHPDHLSGASLITDENGQIESTFTYYPYGSDHVTEERGSYDEDHKYTGQEQDEETGLYYYGARYYDPVTGRFASVDPWEGDLMDPQSLNKYAYVLNNPMKYVDPTGMVSGYSIAAGIVRGGSYVIGGGVALLDGPVPGPADAVGGGIITTGNALASAISAYGAVAGTPKVDPVKIEGFGAVSASGSSVGMTMMSEPAFIGPVQTTVVTDIAQSAPAQIPAVVPVNVVAAPLTNNDTYLDALGRPAWLVFPDEAEGTASWEESKIREIPAMIMGRFEAGPSSGRPTEQEKYNGDRNIQKRNNYNRDKPKSNKIKRQILKQKRLEKRNNS